MPRLAPATEADLDLLAGMGQRNLDGYGAAFESEQTLVTALERTAPGMTTLAPAHGSWLAAAVSGGRARLLTDDGHPSIDANRYDEILDDLLVPR